MLNGIRTFGVVFATPSPRVHWVTENRIDPQKRFALGLELSRTYKGCEVVMGVARVAVGVAHISQTIPSAIGAQTRTACLMELVVELELHQWQ